MTEDKIIQGIKNGDSRTFEVIYNLYYKLLVAYTFNLTNDWSRAEDIVQETLVKIWANRHKLIISNSLKSYLYKSVYHNFISQQRTEERKKDSLSNLKHEILNSLIEIDEEEVNYKLKLLDAAIEQLPKKSKKIFIMHKKEGFKQKEIATYLNLSEKTIEKHISRAINRIKDFINSQQNTSIFFVILNRILTPFSI